MEIFTIEVTASVLVGVEFGGIEEAKKAARDHVANDWLLRYLDGVRLKAGHFYVKGVSAEVGTGDYFVGNLRVERKRKVAAPVQAAELPEGEPDIF